MRNLPCAHARTLSMQRRGILIAGGVIALAVVVCIAIVIAFAPRIASHVLTPSSTEEDAATWAAPVAKPIAAEKRWRAGWAGRVDEEWLSATAASTGIPQRALAAYAGAVLAKSKDGSHCTIGWNTVAAIGYAESRHGTFGGATIADDGTVSPAIYGVALSGGDTEHITDSDGGELDGDVEFDRAIGPMQLIPQTWRNWHVDASGDGVEDPQNIDDAALATANYLCRSSKDFTTEAGWLTAVTSYNSAPAYIALVARTGEEYGAAVQSESAP
jgi:membrane-bound lytic murein transglycosylase B